MFNAEIKKMLVQVITSWQVLVVTGVLVVYIFLVNSVARIYHRRPRQPSMPKVKSKPSEAPSSVVTPSNSDELDLEEDTGEK